MDHPNQSAAFLGPRVLGVVLVLWGLSFLYNMKLKEYGLAGNLIVATCFGMMFVTGGIIAGTINGVVLTFAALAFFFDLGEEIASDAMDVKGDQIRSSESLARRWGRAHTLRLSGLMFTVFIALTLFPFLMGWLGYDYLLLIAITDLWLIWCSVNLIRFRTIENGRNWIRGLYFAWGIFVIIFALSSIL